MGISCGSAIAKYLLFIFNVVFLLSGIVVLVVGAVVLANEPDYSTLVGTDVYSVAILLIVIGCLVIIICFFGCCGAIKENTCMLYTYSALLCVIFIMEFAGGIAAFVYREELKSETTDGLLDSIEDYDCVSYTTNGVTKEWDDLQTSVPCCGANGPSDWFANNITSCGFNRTNSVPWSCCSNSTQGSSCSFESAVNRTGCVQSTVDTINSQAVLLGGIAVGLAFIQILGIIFACCLAADLKH